jgi:hypothetical protein
MSKLKSFAPSHLTTRAEESGFFHCRKCGLFWFGKPDATTCPEGPHGQPVHVALLCRDCDAAVPIDHLVEHLASQTHHAAHE